MAKKQETVKKRKSGSGFMWGLFLGFLTGMVLAILFAPQPGEQTREQLADQGVELRKRGQERYGELRTQLFERYGDALTQGRDAYQKAKEQILAQYAQSKNGR
ncbi:MAG TPA: YtxH domain-containing protein [Ktedonobacterales bacterium]